MNIPGTSFLLITALLIIIILIMMVIQLRMLNRRHERELLDNVMKMRIESARNCITPHFIFNALSHEIYRQQHSLPSNLETLANLLRRGIIHVSNFELSIADEVEFVNLFVAIETDGLEGKPLDYKVSIAPDIDANAITMPTMMLQILVENAIKHGLRGNKDEKLLHIFISREGQMLCLKVLNTIRKGGSEMTPSANSNGFKVLWQTLDWLNHNHRNETEATFRFEKNENDNIAISTLKLPIE